MSDRLEASTGRVRSRVATVIRLVGDFHVAEEAVRTRLPRSSAGRRTAGANPRAWVISDGIRRSTCCDAPSAWRQFARSWARRHRRQVSDGNRSDDRLRLIFTCCHPALAIRPRCRSPRTLLAVDDEIGRAFLVSSSTMAQRLIRAKRKIHGRRHPHEVPEPSELPSRLTRSWPSCLVFNEGYAATAGPLLVRADLCREAITLARLLCDLRPEVSRAACWR